jgi:hypothetical protein
MTRRSPLWQQNGTYSALYDRGAITALWPAGGAIGAKLTTIANTLNINIPPGRCVVPLSDGTCELCVWDAAEVVPIQTPVPPSGSSRRDLIVCTVRDSAIDSGSNDDFIFQTIPGVPATSNPVLPALPANSYKMGDIPIGGAIANLNGLTPNEARSPLLPGTGVHGRVYRNAPFTFGSGAGGALIQMDTVASDPYGLYWSTWGGMILPCPGLWLMRARIGGNPTGTAEAMVGRLRVNQNETIIDQKHASSAWGLTVNLDHVGRQAAGDLIDVTMMSSVGTRNGQPGISQTFLACTYLGP